VVVGIPDYGRVDYLIYKFLIALFAWIFVVLVVRPDIGLEYSDCLLFDLDLDLDLDLDFDFDFDGLLGSWRLI
jgi:hypothetical protein